MLLGSVGVGVERERQKSQARKVIHLCCALRTEGGNCAVRKGGREDETKKGRILLTITYYSPRSNGNDFISGCVGSAAAAAVRLLASIDISVLVMPISLDTAKAAAAPAPTSGKQTCQKTRPPSCKTIAKRFFWFFFLLFSGPTWGYV